MSDQNLAASVKAVLCDSKWVGAVLARAQVMLSEGASEDQAARHLYESDAYTLSKARELIGRLKTDGFTSILEKRTKTGSAENPVTKLFPAAVTERQFLDELDRLRTERKTTDYKDERFTAHTLVDFTITEEGLELPVNVKNAGTRFENAAQLVGLAPDDCVPIPAYKAYDAIEKEPNLLYAISIDYTLIRKIESHLLTLLNRAEADVWRLLNTFAGKRIRNAEDRFIYCIVNRHWETFSEHVALPVFRIISARKAIRILQKQPKRTPGIGLRAWGTGAAAEVNLHISVEQETKSWNQIHQRITTSGLTNIIEAINRKKTEVVFDPEI